MVPADVIARPASAMSATVSDPFDTAIERRALATAIRAQGRKLVGYAATFGTPAEIDGRFTETIRAGAFKATLDQRDDVLALVDHDSGKLLGRTASGTLRLAEDTKGLAFEIDVPSTTLGNDTLLMAERGDLGGMSFGFRALADHWTDQRTRELRSVQLVEVSVVHAFPAYGGTSVHARAGGLPQIVANSAARRRRLVEAL
jgi:HK97 family phage prohead protease